MIIGGAENAPFKAQFKFSYPFFKFTLKQIVIALQLKEFFKELFIFKEQRYEESDESQQQLQLGKPKHRSKVCYSAA